MALLPRNRYHCVEPVAVPRDITDDQLPNYLEEVWAAQGVKDITSPRARYRKPSRLRRVVKRLRNR